MIAAFHNLRAIFAGDDRLRQTVVSDNYGKLIFLAPPLPQYSRAATESQYLVEDKRKTPVVRD